MYWILFWQSFWYSTGILTQTLEDISFEGYWLQNEIIITEYENFFDGWQSEANTFSNPLNHWLWLVSKYWRWKSLILKWIVKCDSQSSLESKLDEIKKSLRKNEWYLRYKRWDWSYREIKTICTSVKFSKEFFNIVWCPFEITFQSLDAFFRDVVLLNTFSENITSSLYVEEITYTWSEESCPQIYFQFTSASWITSVSMEINWKIITYTWTITTGDILIFDWSKKKVYKNNIEVLFSWSFPKLYPWSNLVEYSIDWTFNCNVSNVYYVNYL